MPKITTKEFIDRAKKLHGDKYDYSLVEYINNRTLVNIICSIHGIFEQRPVKHLIGHGCRECGKQACKGNRKVLIEKSLGHKSPELINWIYDNNIDPYIIGNKSTKILRWICPSGHIFDRKICEQTVNKSCTVCTSNSHQSNIELCILFELKYFFNDIQISNKIINDANKNYKYDIYIPSKNMIVEYDGYYSHKNKYDFDEHKSNLAKQNGYKILRIRESPLSKINYNDYLCGDIHSLDSKSGIIEIRKIIIYILNKLKYVGIKFDRYKKINYLINIKKNKRIPLFEI